ncbi:MAG: galactose-1-phosphate uridylyltransferase [Clostridiales bacterium]|nr:galactose-1-phosphate uridylyltransferase [Clostridiales bacterium]
MNFEKLSAQSLIGHLVLYANIHLCLPPEDNRFAYNLICGLLGTDPGENAAPIGGKAACACPACAESSMEELDSPAEILSPLLAATAKTRKIDIDDNSLACLLSGLLMPSPSKTVDIFNTILSDGGGVRDALDWFYALCVKCGYIPMKEAAENIKWRFNGARGPVDVTINVSKPEKSNADIAKILKENKGGGYPQCMLCAENVGYFGDAKTPPRQTLRTLPLVLNGEDWFFQYSPYNYFNEHCIAFSKEHRPMKTDTATFNRLLDFVEKFPHYFLGSNSDLPIVGGSIMTHDHYQGGSYGMPMFGARPRMEFYDFSGNVRLTVPDWGATVLRLTGRSRYDMLTAAETLRKGWFAYANPKLGIVNSASERHNAVTTIARRNERGDYVLELILRNNHTTDERPDGAFHVNPQYFNIKKEGIGLIEAMGVFILPGRLARQARELTPYLTGAKPFKAEKFAKEEPDLAVHAGMAAELLEQGAAQNDAEAGARIERYIDRVCDTILTDIGVFKADAAGNTALIGFITKLGFEIR